MKGDDAPMNSDLYSVSRKARLFQKKGEKPRTKQHCKLAAHTTNLEEEMHQFAVTEHKNRPRKLLPDQPSTSSPETKLF